MNQDTSYTASGYDEYFQKSIFPNTSDSGSINPFDFSSQYQGLSASQVIGGLLKSTNGRVRLDLDNEAFIVSDGLVERVRLGKQLDGSYGLLIKDANGNTLMQITGNTNLIQSFNKHMILNFIDENLTVSSDGENPLVIVGNLG